MNSTKRLNRPLRSSRDSRGIALIEVLVALLVFMLGVLGLIGLQTSMTKAETDSKFRADAAYLANEGVARLWADRVNMAAYDGDSCEGVTRCQEWRNRTSSVLPNGTATMAIDAATGDVAVTIEWKVPSGDTHRYVTHTTVARNTD
ncbi:pilus assembly protein PilV [Variovorax dokdonensis]|uniref:Pilus assembly protein PilV n=1 Tax=Variovorax dokdonensis TaxID=344883 RepID=A0ABT7N9L7_9BURK|nr:pilus assembly protein PilV [Variovorax dokdonensis]MDM0044632.1 pilus assembly protein PilV [Variovorax dokdonensis]